MAALELKVPPVAIFLACAFAMWATRWAMPAANFSLPYAPFLVVLPFVSGMVIAVSGVLRFREKSTTVHPRKPGDATTLVQEGVYRYTRNPMYLGLTLCLGAWGLYLGNVTALLWPGVFVLYMTRFQIRPEEGILLAKFGKEYADYTSTVRRWL